MRKQKSSIDTQLKLFDGPGEKWQPVRDDFNFCRLSLFAAGDKKNDRFRDLEQKYTVEVNGQIFQAVWEVRHDSKLGLPGPFDRDVWFGLMEIINEQSDGGRKPIPDVIEIGSAREFLKRIGKKSGGGNWVLKLKESIQRLTVTTCLTRKAYNCPASGGYLSLLKPIHLIEECAFKGDSDGKGGLNETTWIRLGDYVRKNLDSGYIALLDVQYIRDLTGEITKLLIPFLSYRFWLAVQRGRDTVSVHWQELATFLAALGWDSLSRAKDRLKQTLLELKEKKYIDSDSDWSGDYYVFHVGEKFLDELRNRLNAKEQYKQWVQGKKVITQLQLIPIPALPNESSPSTDAEEREVVLTRQAIRLALLNREPDFGVLARHGWTKDDVDSLAVQLKQRSAASR